MRLSPKYLAAAAVLCCLCSCGRQRHLCVVAPGHFHAALVQKTPLEGVSDEVRVYAPEGPELQNYLSSIDAYNSRAEAPTSWKETVYAGPDYLDKLPQGRGDIAVLAGDNALKPERILAAVQKGYNVLSDKPLCINAEGFALLEQAYAEAERRGLVIYELMTERYDTLNILARQLIADTLRFGRPVSARLSSVHHFCKLVSGKPTTRPEWYYDVTRQGEGIADVTTHLIDQIFWQCFPGETIANAELLDASHYPTVISPDQYALSTGGSLDEPLAVMCNGCIAFAIGDFTARIDVRWDFTAPEGSGDTYEEYVLGTRGAVRIVQDATTGFATELYFETPGSEPEHIVVPVAERLGHEAHFHKVAETFMTYVNGDAEVPGWEYANTISKYKLTTSAVETANR